tara:strand:- start:223 stop:921 length:699 start_codon:yes stop_codon:yes gene_type:complete
MTGLYDIFIENSILYLYALTFLLALYRYRKYFDTPFKYFPILLLYTLLTEYLGGLIRKGEIDNPFFIPTEAYLKNNTLIYNIYTIIFFSYFYYVFWKHLKNKDYKKWVLFTAIGFSITCLINLIFQRFDMDSQMIAYLYGAISLLAFICLYLEENLSNFKHTTISKKLLLWISLGLLLFFIGYIPIKITYKFMDYDDMDFYYTLRRIHLSLIFIMYTFFSYGFIQMKGKSQN